MQHLLTLEYTLEKDAPRTKCHHAHADAIAGLVRLGLAYEAGASRRGSKSVVPRRIELVSHQEGYNLRPQLAPESPSGPLPRVFEYCARLQKQKLS